jgi:IS5 family transposase
VGVTSGNMHDAKVMDRLVRDDDTAVYGDKGYASDAKKRAAEAAGVLWAVKEKARPGGRLTARQPQVRQGKQAWQRTTSLESLQRLATM